MGWERARTPLDSPGLVSSSLCRRVATLALVRRESFPLSPEKVNLKRQRGNKQNKNNKRNPTKRRRVEQEREGNGRWERREEENWRQLKEMSKTMRTVQ